jgi:gas vesicle protein
VSDGDTSGYIAGMLIGAVVGAAVAMLLVPLPASNRERGSAEAAEARKTIEAFEATYK